MPQPTAAFAVTWRDHDGARLLTRITVLFLIGAIALRVIAVPPVNLHDPLHFLGIMDPLCGGTRATFLLPSGDFSGAARYNPLVFPLAAAVLGVVARTATGILFERWLDVRIARGRKRAAWTVGALLLVALEIRQQLNADLLTQSWPA